MSWSKPCKCIDTGEIVHNYKDYLNTKHWEFLRIQIGVKCKRTCQSCSKVFEERNYHVHHITYKRIGQERLNDLILVCKECHRKLHSDTEFTRTFYRSLRKDKSKPKKKKKSKPKKRNKRSG